jgi:hypothetical protein
MTGKLSPDPHLELLVWTAVYNTAQQTLRQLALGVGYYPQVIKDRCGAKRRYS